MKQFFDDFTGTVLTSRGGVRFENGVLIKERIMETENRGGKRNGAGRPKKDNATTKTIAFVCTEEEAKKIDEMTKILGCSRSVFIRQKIFS